MQSRTIKRIPGVLSSNIFLLVPTLISVWKGEWLYFAFCFGLCFASPSYHYLKLYNRKSKFFSFARGADWTIGIGSYTYMYYFIFYNVDVIFQIPLAVLLSLTALYFFYGFSFGEYNKLHARYHVLAFLVSGLIVFLGM